MKIVQARTMKAEGDITASHLVGTQSPGGTMGAERGLSPLGSLIDPVNTH